MMMARHHENALSLVYPLPPDYISPPPPPNVVGDADIERPDMKAEWSLHTRAVLSPVGIGRVAVGT